METRTLVRIALMAAFISVLGLVPPVALPVAWGVPITAQSLAVMLAGLVLGARAGAAAVALFAFVVLLGAPLLSGGRGGLGVLYGLTTGYFIGYIPGAYVTGLAFRRLGFASPFVNAFLACIVGGIAVVHLCGIPVLAWRAGTSLGAAALGSLAFVPGDLLKAVAAALLATTMLARHVAEPPRT